MRYHINGDTFTKSFDKKFLQLDRYRFNLTRIFSRDVYSRNNYREDNNSPFSILIQISQHECFYN